MLVEQRRDECRAKSRGLGHAELAVSNRLGWRVSTARQGTSPQANSSREKFGSVAARWALASAAIGPDGLCGETITRTASAIAAIFLPSQSPPQCLTSGIDRADDAGLRTARTPPAQTAARQ